MVAAGLIAIVVSAFVVLPLVACDAAPVPTQNSFTTTVPVATDVPPVFSTVADGRGRLPIDGVIVIDDTASAAVDPELDPAAVTEPTTLFFLGGMTLVGVALVRRLRDRPSLVPVEVRVRTRC